MTIFLGCVAAYFVIGLIFAAFDDGSDRKITIVAWPILVLMYILHLAGFRIH